MHIPGFEMWAFLDAIQQKKSHKKMYFLLSYLNLVVQHNIILFYLEIKISRG